MGFDLITGRSSKAILLMAFGQLYAYYTFLVFMPPVLGSHLNISVADAGMAFVPLLAGLLMGVFASRAWLGHWPVARQVIAAFFVMAITVLALWLMLYGNRLSYPALLLVMLVYGVGLGAGLPAQAVLVVMMFAASRLSMIGLYGATRFAGAALGPLLGAWVVAHAGLEAAFLVLAGLLLLVAVATWQCFREPSGAMAAAGEGGSGC